MRYTIAVAATVLLASCADKVPPTSPAAATGAVVPAEPSFVVAAAADLSNEELIAFLLAPAARAYRVTNVYAPGGGHAGIDIGNGASGGLVYAPVSGEVIVQGPGCGSVGIFDGFGNTTFLLHMRNVRVQRGARVRQGDVLGEVHSTATPESGCKADGPHLHVEVRPGRWLSAASPKNDNRQTTTNPRAYFAGPAAYGAVFRGYGRLPGAMWPGSEYAVTVVMENTSPRAWEQGGDIRLGSQNLPNNATWGTARVFLDRRGVTRQPIEIGFRARAPVSPGVYAFQWRMVKEYVAWFGDFTDNRAIRVLQPVGLVSLMHGKCLDAPAAANGTRVHMWDCIPGNLNQRWGYSPETGEVKVHGEKCLDGWPGRLLDPVFVYDCHGGATQQWDLTAEGQFRLRHFRDAGRALCMDIAQYARGNAAQLLLYTCHGGENHLWRQDIGGVGGSTVSIATAMNRGMCMDAPYAERNTELHLWDCLGPGLANQRFRRMPDRTLRVHGKCVDAHNGRMYDPVKLWDCHGKPNQQWDLTPAGEFRGVNNLCIDVRGASSARGTKMMLYTCHGGPNQRWSYRDAGR